MPRSPAGSRLRTDLETADRSRFTAKRRSPRRIGGNIGGMSVIPTPVAGERESLLEYLRYHHSVFLAVADGLTDEQARGTDGQRVEHRRTDQTCDRRGIRVDAT